MFRIRKVLFKCLEILLDWYAETLLKAFEQMTLCRIFPSDMYLQSLPDGLSVSISIVNPSGVNFQLEVILSGTCISFIFGVSP